MRPLPRMARNALDYVIVSDGGKPFSNAELPTGSGSIVLKAGLDIMMCCYTSPIPRHATSEIKEIP